MPPGFTDYRLAITDLKSAVTGASGFPYFGKRLWRGFRAAGLLACTTANSLVILHGRTYLRRSHSLMNCGDYNEGANARQALAIWGCMALQCFAEEKRP